MTTHPKILKQSQINTILTTTDIMILITYLNSQNKIIAVKLLNTKIDNYVFEKQLYEQINSSFSKSYFNDFANL